MTDDRSLARRALLEKAILDELSTANDATREEVRDRMIPGDKLHVPGFGDVLVTNPKSAWQVVDWTEFTKWVNDHAPEAYVTQVVMSASWLKRLLLAGEYTDPDTGEVMQVPGIGRAPGNPVLQVRPTDEAHELALGILGQQLAIEGGES